MNVHDLPLSSIAVDQNQPRKRFDQQELRDLAESIREHGVLQPITVVKADPSEGITWRIVTGERRYRAALLAGRTSIPAIVRDDLDADEIEEVQAMENVARADMTPIEEARAFSRMAQRMPASAIARTVGKSEQFVTRRLALLGLVAEVQQLVDAGQLQVWAASKIAVLDPERQWRAVRAILSGRVAWNAIDSLVSALLLETQQSPMFTDAQAPKREKEAQDARDRFERALDAAIGAVRSAYDPRTLELLPEALNGDASFAVTRCKLLESEVRRLRQQIEAHNAAAAAGG